MHHRLGVLLPMREVPNIAGIIEQIDHAADLATFVMRSHGRILMPGKPDVPVQDETDFFLRQLVLEAYYSFVATKEKAAQESIQVPDCEIEGYAGDDRYFDVVVTGLVDAPQGHLSAEIYLRIS